MLQNEKKSKGGIPRSTSVTALACVLALAMVACAVVVMLPGDDNIAEGANTALPTGEDVSEFTEGMTLLDGGTYILSEGNHRAVLENLATNQNDAGGATVILMDGATLTVEGRGYADVLTVIAATNVNTYDPAKNVVFTGIAGGTFTATISMDADIVDGSYQNVEMGLSVTGEVTNAGGSIGDVKIAVAADTPVSVIGTLESNAAIENLGYAYYTSVDSPTAKHIYMGTVPTAAVTPVEGTTYNVMSGSVTFSVDNEDESYTFTVNPTADNTTAIVVSYTSEGGISISGNNAGEVTLVSGTMVGSNAISNVSALVSTKVGNTYTYTNDPETQYVLASTDNDYVTAAVGADITVVDNATEPTVSVNLAPVGGSATITYSSGFVLSGTYASGVTVQTGSVTSTDDDLTSATGFGYATKVGSAYTYYAAGFSGTTLITATADDFIIVRSISGDAAVTAQNVTFSADFTSQAGMKFTRVVASGPVALSGTVDTGTVTLGSNFAINDVNEDSADLIIANGATVLIGDSNTLTVNGGLENNGTLGTVESGSATLIVNANGTYTGVIPAAGVALNVIDLNTIAGAQWVYATYNGVSYTLYNEYTEPIVIDGTDVVSVVVKSATTDMQVDLGTADDAGSVTVAAGYATGEDEDFLTISSTAIAGTVATDGQVTVADGIIGVLIVNGTLGIEGDITAAAKTTLTISEGGVVNVPAETSITVQNLVLNGTINLYGAFNLTSWDSELSGLGALNVHPTAVASYPDYPFLGEGAIELDDSALIIVTDIGGSTGMDLEVVSGTVTYVGGYPTIGAGSSIVIAEGANAIFAQNIKNMGEIVNNGTLTINEEITLTNEGTIANNGEVVIVGTISNGVDVNGTIVNEGTVNVENADAIGAYTGTVTGTNANVQGEGWTSGIVGDILTLTITGDVTGYYFDFGNVNANVVVAGYYQVSMDLENMSVFSGTGTITFSSVEDGDYTLSVVGNGANYAISNGTVEDAPSGSIVINADMYVDGGIYGASITITSDVVVDGNSQGAIVYTTSLTLTGANLNLAMSDNSAPAITIKTGYSDNADSPSSIIAEGVTLDTTVQGQQTAPTYANTLIVVNGGSMKYVTSDSGYLVVEGGLSSNARCGYIYMYNGAVRDGSNILTNAVEDNVRVPDGSAIYNILSYAVADLTSENVVFIAVNEVDLSGFTIARNLTIATGAYGDVIVDAGVTLTIGGDYDIENEATVNGLLNVNGTVYGVITLGAEGSVSAAAFGAAASGEVPAETATVNGIVLTGVTDASMSIVDGTVTVAMAEGSEGITGVFEIPAGSALAFAAEAVLASADINELTGLQIVVGSTGMTFTVPEAEDAPSEDVPAEDMPIEDTPVEETPSETPVEDVPILMSAYTVPYLATASADARTGMVINGDYELNSDIAADNLTLAGGTITTSAEGGVTITVAADATLNFEDVTLGEGVTVILNGTLNVTGDVSGPEGFIKLGSTGTIVGDIDPSLVDAGSTSTTVDTVDELIAALPYFDEITVDVGADAADDAYIFDLASDVTVAGKTITFVGHNGMEYELNVAEGVTLTVGAGDRNVSSIIQGDVNVNVSGMLVLNYADIYADVDAGESNVTYTNTRTTQIGMDSPQVPNLNIGFGNVLEIITTGFNLNMTVNVWGDMVVNGDLTVTSGSEVSIHEYASLTVSENVTVNLYGSMAVDGDAEVNGTVNVLSGAELQTGIAYGFVVSQSGALNVTEGTLGGCVVSHGTIAFDGTSDDACIHICPESTTTVGAVNGTLVIDDIFAVSETGDLPDVYVYNQLVIADATVAEGDSGLTVRTAAGSTTTMTVSGNFNGTAMLSSVIVGDTSESDVSTLGNVVLSDLDVKGGNMLVSSVNADIQGTVLVEGELGFSDSQVTVTGTMDVAVGGAVTLKVSEMTVTGTVYVGSATSEGGSIAADGSSVINATRYVVSVPATEEGAAETYDGVYMAFDDAVDAIETAIGNTVTVLGAQASAGNDVPMGTVVISAGATLTVDGILVFADGAGIDNSANQLYDADQQPVDDEVDEIIVNGTLTLNDSTDSVLNDYDVQAEVIYGEAPVKNYTSLRNAIANGETEITLNSDVILDDNLTIGYGITVSSDSYGIQVGDYTLTVEGVVDFQEAAQVTVGAEGSIVVSVGGDDYANNGYIMQKAGDIDGVAGAHYLRTVPATEEGAAPGYKYIVSTVEHAAADSANVFIDDGDAMITIIGEVVTEADQITFTAPEGALLLIGIDGVTDETSLTAGTIVIGESVVIVSNDAIVDAIVSSGDNSVDLDNVDGLYAVGYIPTVEETVFAIYGDITSGNVTVNGVMNAYELDLINETAMTIDGALTVAGDTFMSADFESSLIVNGTLTVIGTATVAGDLLVTGNVSVSGIMTIADMVVLGGNVSVSGEGDVSIDGDVVVTDTGSITGADLGASALVTAYEGCTVELTNAISTTFNINVKPNGDSYIGYMTVFVNEDNHGVSVSSIVSGEDFDFGEYIDCTVLDDVENWYYSELLLSNTALTSGAMVGDHAQIYAQVDYVRIGITVSTGPGIAVYIDGVPASGTTYLTYGEHEVTYQLEGGYTEGENFTFTFNGATIQNGTIDIQTSSSGWILSAFGAVASQGDIIVDAGSDDMSLTDILLIVLVILIVIMAIIVALRLMRS